LAEGVVVLQWNNGLREVVEIASQDVGRIMYGVAAPVEAFPIAGWCVEGGFKFLDPLL
jgi:hypothetical protein